jgi:hypothetical protein
MFHAATLIFASTDLSIRSAVWGRLAEANRRAVLAGWAAEGGLP